MERVQRLVPMVFVADVERSLAFWAELGFERGNVLPAPGGGLRWALARSERAEVMFARASGPVDPAVQAVLFYLYVGDVAALRAALLARGLQDGGPFTGAPPVPGGPAPGGVVFEIAYPPYMPRGEVRVTDPDGYTLLIGQLE